MRLWLIKVLTVLLLIGIGYFIATAEEIEKEANEYFENPHSFGAIMYLFQALREVIKRVDDIERGITAREHPDYGKW